MFKDTYQYMTTAGNTGRYPFLNLYATYDGDFGNNFLFDGIEMDKAGIVAGPKTYQQLGLAAAADVKANNFPPWSVANGAMYFKFREPVMAEPLDYSSRTGARP